MFAQTSCSEQYGACLKGIQSKSISSAAFPMQGNYAEQTQKEQKV
jgi:hypothetical protein